MEVSGCCVSISSFLRQPFCFTLKGCEIGFAWRLCVVGLKFRKEQHLKLLLKFILFKLEEFRDLYQGKSVTNKKFQPQFEFGALSVILAADSWSFPT